MTSRPDLSIVVPLCNEEESLPFLAQSIQEVCESLEVGYEIIFIDDGSSDQTFSILTGLHQQHSFIQVIQFRKNYGQTAAMAAGFRAARGEIVVSMDGDLQNDPKDIPRLLEKLHEGNGVVCGWRKERKDRFLSRRLPSVMANWIIGKVTGVPIHDNGCSLKAYRRSVIKHLPLYADFHRFIPAMSTLGGAKVSEIVVAHHSRAFGQSKYGISRAWRVCLDLFVIHLLVRCSSRPSLWFGRLGVFSFMLGILSLVTLLNDEASGIVLSSVAFMFLALAGHLMALGILGEMIVSTGDHQPEHLLNSLSLSQKNS